MIPVKYELCFYIPEDGIFHSQRRENIKSYLVVFVYWAGSEPSPTVALQ
jgi:hypothetical protein